MKKVELLAPAGNMDALKAAVAGGCDAVYLGLTNYSARAFAGNFSPDELVEAVRYCHIRDVKVYVTMNTMLTEMEIENAIKDVQFLYQNDVDALLIQDFGLFHYVRTCYPDFPIHCSTQMHVHNLAGVQFMKEAGAKRVVLARETPIETVHEACLTGMEIEVFVYGAVCISYSGQCLMSSALKNRSANRGMCAQCCRLKYFDEEGNRFPEGDYILSPKDLNVIEKVPELITAGVSSMKIEGRMKRMEYVYLVTKTFREAIDAYYAGKEYHVSKQRRKELLLMFNRGFSNGHLFHCDVNERMSQMRPNHQGIQIGTVVSPHQGKVTVKLTDSLHQHDGLRILNEPVDTGLTAQIIEKNGLYVKEGKASDIVTLQCSSKPIPKKGQPLLKTTDSQLMEAIREKVQSTKVQIPITMSYSFQPGKPFALEITDPDGRKIKKESTIPVAQAKTAPLSKERLEAALKKIGDAPFKVNAIRGMIDPGFLPISVINETRRIAIQKMQEARIHRQDRQKVILPYSVQVNPGKAQSEPLFIQSDQKIDGLESGILNLLEGENITPVINENLSEKEFRTHAVLSSIGDFYATLEHCVAGMTLNIANSYACAFFMSMKGIDGIIFSSELSNLQIKSTLEAYQNRYGTSLYAYRLVYGKRVLMYIKDGFRKDHFLKKMTDYHGLQYEIEYNNHNTLIKEPEAYVSDNPYCYGSYLILSSKDDNKERIKEAYEEISRRI